MIIKDHINLPGMAGLNPLIGPNLERFGPRFPATSFAYDPQLRRVAVKAAREIGMDDDVINEGVYSFVAGPSYETMAESRFLRMAGADAVGMSTVPEVCAFYFTKISFLKNMQVIVAVHCGLKVLGLSLITNLVLMNDSETDIEPPNHEEVLRTSQLRAREMQALVGKIVELL
jgi:purine-nucleoside phosphorylase